jgi:hypothetical protein
MVPLIVVSAALMGILFSMLFAETSLPAKRNKNKIDKKPKCLRYVRRPLLPTTFVMPTRDCRIWK